MVIIIVIFYRNIVWKIVPKESFYIVKKRACIEILSLPYSYLVMCTYEMQSENLWNLNSNWIKIKYWLEVYYTKLDTILITINNTGLEKTLIDVNVMFWLYSQIVQLIMHSLWMCGDSLDHIWKLLFAIV